MVKDDILVEYLSTENLNTIKESLKKIVKAHKESSAYFFTNLKTLKCRDDSDVRKFHLNCKDSSINGSNQATN